MRGLLRDWSPGELLALAGLVVAFLWMAVCGIQAVRLDPLPIASSIVNSSTVDDWDVPPPVPAPATPAILAAIHHNPMRPDRRRAEGRYGQERSTAEIQAPEPPRPVPEFRVVGLVRRPNGRYLAAISWNRAPSQLVRLGEMVQGFRLNRVENDSVYLAREDTAVAVAAPTDGFVMGRP